MKKLILNETSKIAYPNDAKWVEFYVNFYDSLVSGLNKVFDEEERKDAVSAAFSKLMARKGPKDYKGKVPQTEAEWYWCLHWQAKAHLSHLMEKHEHLTAYQDYEKNLMENEIQDAQQVIGLEGSEMQSELHDIYEVMCSVCGINPKHSKVFWDWWIDQEDIEDVAKTYHVKRNNIYQIKSKMKEFLMDQGPFYFADYRDAV